MERFDLKMPKKLIKHGLFNAYIRVLAWHKSSRNGFPIFIVGTGRSGTHFLAKTLRSHSELTDLTWGRENPYVFRLVTQAALAEAQNKKIIPIIIDRYKRLLRAAAPRNLVDQSHPNLWHAEQLVSSFPKSKFLLLVRNPYSVVYSMLNHNAVKNWALEWNKYNIPNRFLGIDQENIQLYEEMSLVERCAVRWIAHYERAREVQSKIPDNVLFLLYEDLCNDPSQNLSRVQGFLGLSTPFLTPRVNEQSINKRNNLSKPDRDAIRKAILNYVSCQGREWLRSDKQLLKILAW
ncbi:MAG: sulfotransferase [Aquisalimonadaceae bacterium]